ncbi:MAG: hypothetical protein OQK69_03110 [Gammaproteobacteria bacterium]|nr:hypothetical protein [Gammaproteobacteria bacterium]
MLWQWPGFIAVAIGMATLLVYLRVLDAHASFSGNEPVRYALYCHWLLPHGSEIKLADPLNKRLFHFVRGALFVLAALGMMWLGTQLELWREYPYLDDLMMAFELGFGFVGVIEIITVVFMTLGIQHFLVDSFSADFILTLATMGFFMIQAVALSMGHLLRKYRRGLFARAYFYLMMLLALPLYPSSAMIALGAHNRPPETATILILTGFDADETLITTR